MDVVAVERTRVVDLALELELLHQHIEGLLEGAALAGPQLHKLAHRLLDGRLGLVGQLLGDLVLQVMVAVLLLQRQPACPCRGPLACGLLRQPPRSSGWPR